jgi:hypothetical protein
VTLPLGIQVRALLAERVPNVHWDPRLVAQCVADFSDVDVVEVAARCAAYMQETPAAKNGPRTLRTFLERERRDRAHLSDKAREAKRLAPYHRPKNRST